MVNKEAKILIIIILVILSACTKPAAEVPTATVVPTFIPSASSTLTPVPNNTVEPVLIINPEIPILLMNETNNVDEYSSVNMGELLSGELLEFEKKYIQNESIFKDDVLPIDNPNKISSQIRHTTANGDKWSLYVNQVTYTSKSPYKNPENRPIKILSFYKIIDDQLFEEIGFSNYDGLIPWQEKQPDLWIMTWAYKNPDSSVALGHTLIHIDDYLNDARHLKESQNGDLRLFPGFEVTNIVYADDELINTRNTFLIIDKIYSLYPDLDPKSEIDAWIQTKTVNSELEKKLFMYQTIRAIW